MKYDSDGVVFKHKPIVLLMVFCFLLMGLAGLAAYKVYFANWSQISVNTVTLPAIDKQPINILWPTDGQTAVSAVGSPIIFESSKNVKPKPTASVAKLMTALTVLKKYPLKAGQSGPTITMTGQDVITFHLYAAQDGSVVPVRLGEKFSEYQVLQAILLPSANNMADSLAIWAYGSLNNYHKAANQLAKSLGMNKSYFADDASGFSPSTTSTPSDLVLLGKAALQNSVIKQVVAQKSAKLPYVGTIYNTNRLLGQNGFSGLKTGFTPEAGYCLLFTTTRLIDKHKITLMGSINGQISRQETFNSAGQLADNVYENLRVISVAKANQTLANYSAAWPGSMPSLATKNLSVIAWNNETPIINIKPIRFANYQPAKVVSGLVTAKTSFGTSTANLYLGQPINPPSITWRLLH